VVIVVPLNHPVPFGRRRLVCPGGELELLVIPTINTIDGVT